MDGRKMSLGLIALFLIVLFLAWFDGGEEPLHPIEQKVDVPEGVL